MLITSRSAIYLDFWKNYQPAFYLFKINNQELELEISGVAVDGMQ